MEITIIGCDVHIKFLWTRSHVYLHVICTPQIRYSVGESCGFTFPVPVMLICSFCFWISPARLDWNERDAPKNVNQWDRETDPKWFVYTLLLWHDENPRVPTTTTWRPLLLLPPWRLLDAVYERGTNADGAHLRQSRMSPSGRRVFYLAHLLLIPVKSTSLWNCLLHPDVSKIALGDGIFNHTYSNLT